MAEEDSKKLVLDTPESILKDAVLRFKKLDKEADEASSENDAVRCRQKLTERARLIADLPARVRETMVRRQSFPEEGLCRLEDFSELARRGLEDRLNLSIRIHFLLTQLFPAEQDLALPEISSSRLHFQAQEG